MRLRLFLLAMIPCSTYAGYDEHRVIDMTACKAYVISNEHAFEYDPDPAIVEQRLRHREAVIEELRQTHDPSQWYEGWVADIDFATPVFGFCREAYDMKINEQTLFQCDGGEHYPLPKLTCRFGTGNRWHQKCTIEGKPRHDIRMYWVDTAEYEEGVGPMKNIGYNRDLARMRNKCKAKK